MKLGAFAPEREEHTLMRKKSWLTLAAVTAIIAFFAVVAFTGLTIGHTQCPPPLKDLLSLGLDLRGGIYTVFYADDAGYDANEFQALLDGTASVLRTRLTDQGFTEANVSIQGTNYIRVEIPDISDPQEVLDIIGTPAHLSFVDPYGNVIIEGKDVKEVGIANNTDVKNGNGGYMVVFDLNDDAAEAFEEATARFVGSTISILLDGEVISAPTVQQAITGGSVSITLNAAMSAEESYNEARRLATLIMSGSLPLDIEESETRAISATLGEDAIDRAFVAGVIGVAVIFLFMIVMYRLPGLMADLALSVYILIVFYILAEFQIQLTLPGIAGILLGIGMAVDSNVVIFERFREELKAGRSYESASKNGYKNALRAIIDANVTTLISAFVLMYFGTGSIKGFSYTLTLGVITSLLTAVFVTRFLLKQALRLGFTGRWLYTR